MTILSEQQASSNPAETISSNTTTGQSADPDNAASLTANDQELLENGLAFTESSRAAREQDEEEYDNDDELTVIVLDNNNDDNHNTDHQGTIAWIEQTGPEMEERRRTVLLAELKRVQRASFMHFLLLCLIPTVLLIIVVATVVGEEEECESDATICELEARTFVNAFTTRCVCSSIAVDRQSP